MTDDQQPRPGPLTDVRVIDVSMLGPGELTTHLGDLGADVVKVEPPGGDYARKMTWPFIGDVSMLHLHIARGKRSIVLDLRTDEGVAVFLDLVATADAVVEAMRPGALDKRGLGFDQLRAVNPAIVLCSISGYGATGPYRDMPSHGLAYDAWAGLVAPAIDGDGFAYIPEHPSVGIHTGPLYGALALLAGVMQARTTGRGCHVEIAQSDAAAATDWIRSEAYKAYERPEDEVTGNPSDNYVRRAPGTAGMADGVRYQFYESSDGAVLFMASERKFWKNFCEGVGRADLFESHPGAEFADHARGDVALRAELRDIFRSRTTAEWVAFGDEVNSPISPVNTPKTIASDPQFQARLPWMGREELGGDQMPFPALIDGQHLPVPAKAPTPGEHSAAILRDLLAYDDTKIAALQDAGALG